MSNWKKLLDTEFEMIKSVWVNEPPITTNMVMEQFDTEELICTVFSSH